MASHSGPDIIEDELVLALDAANVKSYGGSGSTWKDLSGKKNDGTIDGATYNSDGYFTFDGSNDFIDMSSTEIGNTFWQGAYSVSVWVYQDTLSTSSGGSDDKAFIHHGIFGNSQGLHLVQRGNKLHYGFYSNDLSGNSTVSANVWYNATFTYSGNSGGKNRKIYLNASLDASDTSSSNYANTSSNTVIAKPIFAFGDYFDGNISQVSIYNKELSAAEVNQNFNALRGRYGI